MTNKIHHKTRFLALILIFLTCGLFTAGCSNQDYNKLEGVWELQWSDGEGYTILVIEDGFYKGAMFHPTLGDEFGQSYSFSLDTSKKPRQFDAFCSDSTSNDSPCGGGLYEVDENQLKIAALSNDEPRPTSFTSKNTFVFKRMGRSIDFVPVDSNYIKGLTTWVYLKKMASIFNKIPKVDFKSASSLMDYEAKCEQAIKNLSYASSELSELPILGVDSKVTSYIPVYLTLFNRGKSVIREMERILVDGVELSNRTHPGDRTAIAILELLLGSPGKNERQLDFETQQLATRLAALQAEGRSFDAEVEQLNTNAIQLRSNLSETYKREFPKLNLVL